MLDLHKLLSKKPTPILRHIVEFINVKSNKILQASRGKNKNKTGPIEKMKNQNVFRLLHSIMEARKQQKSFKFLKKKQHSTWNSTPKLSFQSLMHLMQLFSGAPRNIFCLSKETNGGGRCEMWKKDKKRTQENEE